MEKFGVSFGGGPSRKELLEAVEQQKAELQRYQARLRDLVRAHKSLLTEKAALEASLRALSAPGPAAPPPEPPPPAAPSPEPRGSDGGWAHSQESPAGLRPREAPGEEEEEEAAGGAGAQLKAQLATLTGALATVAQEKSRMEASYQADKRKAKQEAEEARRWAAQERSRLEAELAETRARLAAQQQDRAQEQSDHAVMLRELQRLVQSERALRQEAELGLEEARQALAGKSGAAERAEDSERQARQLAQEVGQLKRELQAVREESCRPDLRLQELQAEMAGLRSHLQAQLLQETRKAAQADEHVQMREQRVASLEAQISEMSELLGTYEKAKQKDQMTIQKLKDRIVQLDLENKTLAVASSGHSALSLAIEEGCTNMLREKVEMLRELAHVATEDTRTLAQAVEAPGGTEPCDGEKEASAAYYQQELKQLKEEFERYKLRAQVVLRNKSAKDGNLARELEGTQEQLAELKEKYVSLRLSWEEVAKQHEEQLEANRREASLLQQFQRQELERCRLGCQEKVVWLEEEMHKQRERALAVLGEKDQELEQLRALAGPWGLQGSKALDVPGPREPPRGGGDGGGSNQMADSSLENLTQALHLAATNEPTFFLYTEQLARKEVEVLALKKEKHRLEMEVHQFQERLLEAGEKHQEEVSVLQSRIQKTIRDQSREGANLEYLKNIFYRFLTLTDWLGRQQTLTAILTILHFSPEEAKAVLSQASGGNSWWLPGKR